MIYHVINHVVEPCGHYLVVNHYDLPQGILLTQKDFCYLLENLRHENKPYEEKLISSGGTIFNF